MPRDIFKPVGPLKASRPDAGGANVENVARLGVVKDNIDPTRSGRIAVYISDNNGSDPNDRDNWVTVSYLSPFFGKTIPDAPDDSLGDFKNNPSSYGFWNSPPDIGTTVVCIFVNGDPNFGFYIGCVPDPTTLQMVPAIGATENIIPNEGEAKSYGGAVRLPVTNINTNNASIADTADYITAPKPIHSYSAAIMFQQGVLRDPIRGAISSSAQRETPSRVGWGVSTPGRPIYEGGYDDETIASNLETRKNPNLRVVSRRGGHSIVMYDGDVIGRDQLIRLRTALGHQILMSDDGQTLMILHSNGQSYIELGKEGTVDVYSTNSINLRTQGDLNLHADNNININATKKLNIQASEININTDENYNLSVGKDYQSSSAGKHTNLVGGAYSVKSAGQASMASDAEAFINGTNRVNLNTGKTGTNPEQVKPVARILHTDTLFDKEKGFAAAPGKLPSIVSRAPAHAPWADAGKGVDVKINLNADSQLPSSPKSGVSSVNRVAAGTSTTPVTPSTTSSIPNVGAASSSIDKGTTNAVLGQLRTDASQGAAAIAQNVGAAVIPTAQGAQAVVGQFAQTPTQLEAAGVLKQGAATLVNNLVASGSTVTSAMTDNLFTGKPGAANLNQIATNVVSQAEAAVTNIQQSQTALTNAGVMTGKESNQQVSGVIMSGVQNGINKTIDAVKGSVTGQIDNITGSVLGTAGNLPTGSADGVLKSIAGGLGAASLASTVTGGLGSLNDSVVSMQKIPSLASLIDQSKGVAASTFSAITGGFTPMTPNVPQDLKELAKKKAESTLQASLQGAASDLTNMMPSGSLSASGLLGAAKDKAISSVSGKIANKAPAGAGAVLAKLTDTAASVATNEIVSQANKLTSQATGALSSFTNSTTLAQQGTQGLKDAASSVASGFAASAGTTLASGMNNLPGGQKVAASIVNNSTNAITGSVPGLDKVSGLIKDASSKALNGLAIPSLPSINDTLSSFASAGLPSGAIAQLQASISALGSEGGVSVKLPTLATNTTDRSAITSQITNVLNDPKIPKPNLLGKISETAISDLDKQLEKSQERLQELEDWNKEFDEKLAANKQAEEEYLTLLDNVPAGDPQIETAYNKWVSAYEEYENMSAKLDEIQEKYG
jgi:hypothetical protein